MKILIVDEGFIGSLHTALALRDAGLDVVLFGAVGSRRSCRQRSLCALTGPVPSHADFVPALRAVAIAESCDVIMPATEPAMLALHGAAADLPCPLFPRLTAEHERLIRSKAQMSDVAAAAGARIPRQLTIADTAHVSAAVRKLGAPLVVKAIRGRGGDGTCIVRDAAQAEKAVRRMLVRGRECILQEYIAGATCLVGGLFRDGRPVRVYAGEKTEQQPPLTGPASRIRSMRSATLLRAALRVFDKLRWTGLASSDFVRDARGDFHFLEINPRPWGSIAAAAAAGVDLFTPLAEMLAGGLPATDVNYAADVDTRVLPLYLLNRERWLHARALRDVLEDVKSRQGAMFRDAGLAVHVVHRLLRVRANWPSGTQTGMGR